MPPLACALRSSTAIRSRKRRSRFAWIELHNDDHYVLPLTDEDMASFSARVQELRLTEWNGYHKIDRDMLDGVSFSLSVEFEDGNEQ